MQQNKQMGGILIITVIFVMMLTVMFSSLSGMTNALYKRGSLAAQDETAFQIAESGLNFARWRLAHAPTDYTPVTRTISDPLRGELGTYEVSFTAPSLGSNVVGLNVVGYTAGAISRRITIDASYGKPSFAKYSSLTNDDVWYASAISGAVHSNGGIRMDGVSDSSMSSARATYLCQQNQGCSTPVEQPGIWGTGGDSSFWQYPVASVDYSELTSDLLTMKDAAQSANTYFGPSGAYGYRLQFLSNHRYRVYTVTAKNAPVTSYASDTGWQTRSDNIGTQVSLLGVRTVPANGILFFEDTVWVDGPIEDRITVAAGRAPYSPDPNTNVDIIINGSITYNDVLDGTRAFAAIAQGNILIPYQIVDVLRLDGAYVAQYGRFGRRLYTGAGYNMRSSLTRYGMVASNLVPVTSWSDGFSVQSGYINSFSTYDPNLLFAPPPFFPTSGSYQILSWRKTE